MRVLLQRSLGAEVAVSGSVVGKINYGLVIFVGFTDGDSEKNIDYLINKIVNLRIFDDDNGVMNRSLIDVGGSVLSISQFTLYADCSKGRRPSYAEAMSGDKAIKLYDVFNQKLGEIVHLETGIFGAEMKVSLVNDGPITIMLEN